MDDAEEIDVELIETMNGKSTKKIVKAKVTKNG